MAMVVMATGLSKEKEKKALIQKLHTHTLKLLRDYSTAQCK